MEYNVKRLRHGYIVSDKDYEPIGAFSSFDDMVVWLNEKFDVEFHLTMRVNENFGKVPNEWVEWKGGKCPVDGKSIVELKLFEIPNSGKPCPACACDWNWRAEKEPLWGDIIAYRVVTSVSPAPHGE